jgi:hypothetical protein
LTGFSLKSFGQDPEKVSKKFAKQECIRIETGS